MLHKKKLIKKKTVKERRPKAAPGDKRIGNQFWKMRSKHGRDTIFESPEILWQESCKYFEWCESHPLYESKAFNHQGEVIIAKLPKMRALTLAGLCFFLRCNEHYLRQLRANENKDFSSVISEIEKVIYNQKFQGAAADLLNANIIARDLGLKDNTDFTSKGEKINNPIMFLSVDRLTDKQIEEYLKQDAGTNDESI